MCANSEVARLLNQVLQIRDDVTNDCWYAPCQQRDNKPATVCTSDVIACIQVNEHNTYVGGGTNTHVQQCNVAESAEKPSKEGTDKGTGGGGGTPAGNKEPV